MIKSLCLLALDCLTAILGHSTHLQGHHLQRILPFMIVWLWKLTPMLLQYIEQQNELIRSLRQRMKSHEEAAEDSISKEREVSWGACYLTLWTCHGPTSPTIITVANGPFLQLELQRIIDDQTRELALVSSAWFHLQSRLQNSSVAVSRYRQGANLAEAQKGWLARQRRIVVGR